MSATHYPAEIKGEDLEPLRVPHDTRVVFFKNFRLLRDDLNKTQHNFYHRTTHLQKPIQSSVNSREGMQTSDVHGRPHLATVLVHPAFVIACDYESVNIPVIP